MAVKQKGVISSSASRSFSVSIDKNYGREKIVSYEEWGLVFNNDDTLPLLVSEHFKHGINQTQKTVLSSLVAILLSKE